MPWFIRVILFILVGRILHPIFVKRVADEKRGRMKRLVWQFFFTAILAVSAAIARRGFDIVDSSSIIVIAIGAANAFACYCSWRAVAVSQSETALFTQLDDVICLALGYLVLGEQKFFSLPLAVGLVMVFGAAIFISFIKSRRSAEAKKDGLIVFKGIMLWILLYSVIWGGASFSKRYFALAGIPLVNYLAAWYVGSFGGALVVCWFGDLEEKAPLDSGTICRVVLPVALTAWLSNFFSYWCFMLLPTVVMQPIDQVSEMVFPVLVGLFIFRERNKVFPSGRRDNPLYLAAMVLAFIGGLIIARSYAP